MKELLYKKCASVETTNEENCTEGIDSEENYVSIQEDVEEAIPDGAKPIPATTLNSWPTFCQHFWNYWHQTKTGKVFARCKCRVRSPRMDAMSNFNRHTRNLHKDDYNSISKKRTSEA
jgi:hypothetical protein